MTANRIFFVSEPEFMYTTLGRFQIKINMVVFFPNLKVLIMMIISIVHICINELKITQYLENCKRSYTNKRSTLCAIL